MGYMYMLTCLALFTGQNGFGRARTNRYQFRAACTLPNRTLIPSNRQEYLDRFFFLSAPRLSLPELPS